MKGYKGYKAYKASKAYKGYEQYPFNAVSVPPYKHGMHSEETRTFLHRAGQMRDRQRG